MTDLLAEVRGCTFDDFLFTPQFSVLERRDPRTIDLSSRLSEHLTLKHPIVSANMDTITRSAMAIVQAHHRVTLHVNRGKGAASFARQHGDGTALIGSLSGNRRRKQQQAQRVGGIRNATKYHRGYIITAEVRLKADTTVSGARHVRRIQGGVRL